MKHFWKRLLASVLAIIMMAGIMPPVAYAAVSELVTRSAVENAALLEALREVYLLQAYVTQENGRAKMGAVLFTGTPQKCRELMGQLKSGELTEGQVKELYAKARMRMVSWSPSSGGTPPRRMGSISSPVSTP